MIYKEDTRGKARPGSVSLNSLMRHGGVTLQNITWKRANGSLAGETDCTLPIILDLLDGEPFSYESRKLISRLFPAHVRPIIIYGAMPLVAPALEVNTLNEIILTGNSVCIEPQMHKIRTTSQADKSTSIDTILFCSGVVVGNKSVIVGAAFSDHEDRDESASASLQAFIHQLNADQISLTDVFSGFLKTPNLVRALLDTSKGKIIWRSASARKQWERRSSLATYLANTRYAMDPSERQVQNPHNCRQLTLVTFLRADTRLEIEAQRNHSFRLSADVRKRLIRVIEQDIERGQSAKTSRILAGDPVAPELAVRGSIVDITPSVADDRDTNQEDVRSEMEHGSEKRISAVDLSNETESHAIVDKDTGRFEEARRALVIALRALPAGGYLKLSPVNSNGQVRMEAFDKDGESAVDITLTDKSFPDSDNIL